jgi:hypothetical protein
MQYLQRALTDISQMPFKFTEIVHSFFGLGNGIPSAATRRLVLGEQAVFEIPFSQFCRHSRTPSRRFASLSICSAYTGTGLRRRLSTRLRIFPYRPLGTAISAN